MVNNHTNDPIFGVQIGDFILQNAATLLAYSIASWRYTDFLVVATSEFTFCIIINGD